MFRQSGMTDTSESYDGDEETNAIAVEPQLVAAVNDGSYERTKRILARLPKRSDRVWVVNVPNKNGSTVLFTAAWNKDLELCKLLVDSGAKIGWKNLRGNTPLHMAVERNALDIVKLFLLSGAEPVPGLATEIRKRTGKKISAEIEKLLNDPQVGPSARAWRRVRRVSVCRVWWHSL